MKEFRSQRYQELQMPQRHICDIVSMYLGFEPKEVTEGVIDNQSQVDLFEKFVNRGRTRCMFFFYQDGPPYEMGKICGVF